LVFLGKAEVVENGRGYVHSPSRAFPRPSVIRLNKTVRRPYPRVRLSKKEIFRRDNYTCQYCGRPSNHLTLDHVVPRHRGGSHSWDNLVSACPACNRRKGGRTPQEANMRLLRSCFEPRANGTYTFRRYLEEYQEWRKFIEGW
jgi:5-methylcytosine-specific restriction endonuclease McrA